MKFLPLIWSNLRRKTARTILTVLSIFIAFILFGYLAAIDKAFSMGVEVAGADRLVVRHRVSIILSLPLSYQERIQRIPGVQDVTHATWFGGIYQDPKNFFPQFPVVPEEYLKLYPELILPEAERAAWLKTRTGAVAGRSLAEKYGWKVGDRIPIQATVWTKKDGSKTWDFDLVGIYDGARKGVDTNQFLFRYDYFDEARAFMRGSVGWYIIRVKDPGEAAAVAKAIDEEFANSPYETKTETEKAFVQAFAKQVGNIGAILTIILSAVIFTILLIAGNTMAHAVQERVAEIGVLKALGFTNLRVLGLVLLESMLIAVAGGGLGLLVAWIAISRGDPTGGRLANFYLTGRDAVTGLVLVFALGLVTGILPALQAMRLRIVDAMRRT
jgi:putative ABC transport system permease protein